MLWPVITSSAACTAEPTTQGILINSFLMEVSRIFQVDLGLLIIRIIAHFSYDLRESRGSGYMTR